METKQKDLAAHIAVIVLFQAVSSLISRSSGTAFLISLIVILAYDTYRNILTLKETAVAFTAFLLSGLGISGISKVFVYSKLCDLSGSMGETGGMNALPSSTDACLTIPEIFLNNITYNPVAAASFWIPTLAISAGAVYIYRNYR